MILIHTTQFQSPVTRAKTSRQIYLLLFSFSFLWYTNWRCCMPDLPCFSYTDHVSCLHRPLFSASTSSIRFGGYLKKCLEDWKGEKQETVCVKAWGTGFVNPTLQVRHLPQVCRVLRSISCATFSCLWVRMPTKRNLFPGLEQTAADLTMNRGQQLTQAAA